MKTVKLKCETLVLFQEIWNIKKRREHGHLFSRGATRILNGNKSRKDGKVKSFGLLTKMRFMM
jgi:hypothetical protein